MTVVKLSPVPADCAWRAAVVGISGTGKSFAAKAFVRELMARQKRHRVLAFDPCDEWSARGRPGADLGPLKERVTFDDLLRDPSRYLDVEPLSLAVVPSDDEDESAEQAHELVQLVKATGDMLVVFDEVGDYGFTQEGAKALSVIARKGRHWRCPALFVAQRLTHLPPNARSQLTELATFLQTHPADVAALEDLTGDKGFAGRVQKLDPKKREALVWRGAARGEEDT